MRFNTSTRIDRMGMARDYKADSRKGLCMTRFEGKALNAGRLCSKLIQREAWSAIEDEIMMRGAR